MTTPALARIGNRIGVWLYRKFGGRLSAGRAGVNVLLLTVAGRRTGIPRSTCVRFLASDDGLIVWGTGSGSAREPDWFRNLRAAGVAQVQLGRDTFAVHPNVLVGPELSTTWTDVVLAQAPEVARYARKAGRTIPVALLQRLD
jgi:deazaflavin-dependent oxidoreductase (nitroreductase family)